MFFCPTEMQERAEIYFFVHGFPRIFSDEKSLSWLLCSWAKVRLFEASLRTSSHDTSANTNSSSEKPYSWLFVTSYLIHRCPPALHRSGVVEIFIIITVKRCSRWGCSSASSSYRGPSLLCRSWLPSPTRPWLSTDCNNRWQCLLLFVAWYYRGHQLHSP